MTSCLLYIKGVRREKEAGDVEEEQEVEEGEEKAEVKFGDRQGGGYEICRPK